MSLLKLSQVLIQNRVKQSSSVLIAPVVASALDTENAADAAIAGSGITGIASIVGAPYTYGPGYELARTEEQLKKYKDLLNDPNATFTEKMKARAKYYNPVEAVKDYRAKNKNVSNAGKKAVESGKALMKSYGRSALLGLGGAGIAAGYTRFGEDLLGDKYIDPSDLFAEEETGLSTEDKIKLLAAGTLATGAGIGYLKGSKQNLPEEPEEALAKLSYAIKKKKDTY